jgi:thioredoxin-like negative regulator of GroEL
MSTHPEVIQHITDYNRYLELTSSTPCIVKFTADWCGPCKRLAPYFEKLASEDHNLVNFLEINIEKANEITDYENVTGIPLILFYNGTKQSDLTVNGFAPSKLEDNCKSFIDSIKAECDTDVDNNESVPESESDTDADNSDSVE